MSEPFADGKTAGQVSKGLQSGGELDVRLQDGGFALWLNEACVARSPVFADAQSCQQAISRMQEALAAQD